MKHIEDFLNKLTPAETDYLRRLLSGHKDSMLADNYNGFHEFNEVKQIITNSEGGREIKGTTYDLLELKIITDKSSFLIHLVTEFGEGWQYGIINIPTLLREGEETLALALAKHFGDDEGSWLTLPTFSNGYENYKSTLGLD